MAAFTVLPTSCSFNDYEPVEFMVWSLMLSDSEEPLEPRAVTIDMRMNLSLADVADRQAIAREVRLHNDKVICADVFH
jgi:hypothetical protein